jgi:hypothetical protein
VKKLVQLGGQFREIVAICGTMIQNDFPRSKLSPCPRGLFYHQYDNHLTQPVYSA